MWYLGANTFVFEEIQCFGQIQWYFFQMQWFFGANALVLGDKYSGIWGKYSGGKVKLETLNILPNTKY